MQLRIALAGNPNSGKTTLFNALTGSNQFVGNWPGVTVEKKEGTIRKSFSEEKLTLIDLPGVYSLSPYTLEEVVARNFLIREQPDLILNIVDGSNLERNLYLTTQLLELGIPVVIAVNMMDVIRKNGDRINMKKLASELGCPVVEISALRNEGLDTLVRTAVLTASGTVSPVSGSGESGTERSFSTETADAIRKLREYLPDSITAHVRNWYAEKLLEEDEKVMEELALSEARLTEIADVRTALEDLYDDDAESIITGERYDRISRVIRGCYVRKNKGLTTSDKIDQIVTNKWLALPIFAAVMFLVYYVSVTTVGTWVTDWMNDGVFGEGWSLFGLAVPGIPDLIGGWMEAAGTADWMQGLILDGIVAGVGAVIGFVPQMFVLFLCLSFLEACGYMSRIAFIMDRIFRRFGLSGKSFIPMLIATGCGVPGIMASRTIENERDRRMTVITTTFMPCGAKMPIIALIAGALFGGVWWVAPSAYFIGIGAIIISGIILKKTSAFTGDPAPFIIELPAYHWPTLRNLWTNTWERSWSFIKKAGTIILLATVIIWFLSSFGWDGGIVMTEMDESFLAAVGNSIAWVFSPLGWGHWKAAVATFTGLIAKENVVSTFGVLFGAASEVSEDGMEIWTNMAAAFTPLAAYSFLVFNLLCAPCFAAIGAIRREMNSARWTLFAVGYQCLFAYCAALIIYQTGLFATTGMFTLGTLAALVILAAGVWMLVRPQRSLSPAAGVEEGALE